MENSRNNSEVTKRVPVPIIILIVAVIAVSVPVAIYVLLSRLDKTDSIVKEEVESEYNPDIDPSEFSTEIDNPYFSLPVGRKMVYESETEDGFERVEIEVLPETREIIGVETIIYWDRVWLDGELIEDTRDYLAQDLEGNVWYFGEDVDIPYAILHPNVEDEGSADPDGENGQLVEHAGAWKAGEDGAKPGIWIKANPVEGDSYRQEYYLGEAEDMCDIVAVGVSVDIGMGEYQDCVKVLDWTPLDPEAREHKYYCKEIGMMVLEEDIESGERAELVSIE